jgi:CheY-like chemotaxis protein
MEENGYTVVAVQNGGEGVREVLNGEFSLILCDLMMPTLPGDMFYRAVERINPRLCTRFVFMSGHRCEAKMNEFISSIGTRTLQKPFPLNHLLDLLAFADVCDTYKSVFDFDPSAPGEEPVRPEAGSARLAGNSRSRPAALAVESVRPRSTAKMPAVPLTVERHSSAFALAALALPLVLALVLGLRYEQARVDAADAVAAHQTFDAERRALAPQVEAALSARPELERTLGLPARIAADRAKPRWAWALRTITPSLEGNIELQGLRAHQMADAPGACDVRIDGVSFGPEARAIADRVRIKMEQELRRGRDSEPVKTGFLKLADEPESASELPNQNRVTFEIVATVGVKDPAVFEASFRP